MKLSLRYFLLLSLVLGAIVLPLAWKGYAKWREKEIARLEKELSSLRAKYIDSFVRDALQGADMRGPVPTPAKSAATFELEGEIERVANRLEKLTGNATSQSLPGLEVEDVDRDGALDVKFVRPVH